jgi:hypothetical protein
MARAATSYGRFQVAEPPPALASLHQHDGSPLKEVDHEPKVGVLDQEDLIEQGINTATLIPGAKEVDALGSCTANAGTSGLSNLLSEARFAAWVGKQVLVGGGTVYADVVATEEAAIRFYHTCTDQTGTPAQEWPPTDCGSSGPYVVSELQRLGLASGAKVASGADNIVSLMQTDGLLVGQPFLNAWEEPDANGFIDGNGSVVTLEAQIKQGVAGGHETYWSAIEKLALLPSGHVDARKTVIRFRNSWTKSWGDNGSARLHLSTFIALGGNCDFRQLIA